MRPTSMLLALPVALVVLVSGCVIPGLDFILGGRTISYEDDVVVVNELRAVPDKVNPNQKIRVIAYVQNIGEKSFSGTASSTSIAGTVDVSLYDHCSGLFTIVESRCGGNPNGNSDTCKLDNFLPKEIKQVDWVLQPSPSTRITTLCNLKVAASYPYTTLGVTSVGLINPNEYQRQLELGQFSSVQSTITKGQGPIKAYVEVKDQQPLIANSGESIITLNIENAGSGFLALDPTATSATPNDIRGPAILKGRVITTLPTADGITQGADCRFVPNPQEDIRLIRDKAPPLVCNIKLPDASKVAKETTTQISTEASYQYEFRAQVPVTVEVIA